MGRFDHIKYEVWLDYDGYEKQECDIKLHNGTIIKHLYPNAGEFHKMCGDRDIDPVSEKEVVQIMYRRYYARGLCTSNCNGDENYVPRKVAGWGDPHPTEVYEIKNTGAYWSDAEVSVETPPQHIREGRKIGRNEPCPCGATKEVEGRFGMMSKKEIKYKNCCINKKED